MQLPLINSSVLVNFESETRYTAFYTFGRDKKENIKLID